MNNHRGWFARHCAAPVALTLTLAACGGNSSPIDSGSDGGRLPAGFCTGPTALVYDPFTKKLGVFPDDLFTRDDPTSVTGLRVQAHAGVDLDLPVTAMAYAPVFEDLSTLDGSGTTSALFVQFTGEIDAAKLGKGGDGSGTATAPLVLVDLDATPTQPVFVDAEWAVVPEFAARGDRASTIVISPMVALKPKRHYALVVTTRVRAVDGSCIAPSVPMAQALVGTATDPRFVRLAPRYADLIGKLKAAGTIAGPTDVVSATVFTTQHTVDDSVAIAKDIRTRKFAYAPIGPCAVQSAAWRCLEGSYDASDYRVMHHHVDETRLGPQDPYKLKVTIWLPPDATQAPYPTLIYGHGLGGDRHQANALADIACPRGFAVVAIDAVKHGEHPDRPKVVIGDPRLDTIISFFGFSLKALDARALRDNWRQSTYDKLQLVELLRGGIDADGDRVVDVGLKTLTYLGVSLGGIMSAEFLALAPDVEVAIPIVPGARVTDIVRDGADLSKVVQALRGAATDGDIARFFPVLQAAIDRGDSGAYTGHILKDRFAGFDARVPQLLMQMVINDTIVPNSTNRFFARGLGVPHVGDELQKIGTIPHAQTLPTSGNLDAAHTAGVFQFDLVWKGPAACCDQTMGSTEAATHGNVAANPVAVEQSFTFLDEYRHKGQARIVDPYRTLKLKP